MPSNEPRPTALVGGPYGAADWQNRSAVLPDEPVWARVLEIRREVEEQGAHGDHEPKLVLAELHTQTLVRRMMSGFDDAVRSLV